MLFIHISFSHFFLFLVIGWNFTLVLVGCKILLHKISAQEKLIEIIILRVMPYDKDKK